MIKCKKKEIVQVIQHNHNPIVTNTFPGWNNCHCLVYGNKLYSSGSSGRKSCMEIVPVNTEYQTIATPVYFSRGAAVIYDGTMHLLGGDNSKQDHYKYDSSTGTFVSESTLPVQFYRSPAVVYNGKIYIFTSTNVYTWDGSSWTNLGSTSMGAAIGAVVYNNTIYVYTLNGLYRLNNGSWVLVTPLPTFDCGTPSYVDNSIVSYNNKILILDDYKYHIWNGSSWSEAIFPYKLGHFVVYNNKLYVIGGSFEDMMYKLNI